MIFIISSAEPSTTTELTKRSNYKENKTHAETFQHSSNSSSSVISSKGPKGSKFDAIKTSNEKGSHTKSDQASVEAKNKNGEFSANKSSGGQDGFNKDSSSEVHASKDKNGSKVDANKGSTSLETITHTQNSKSNVHAADNHGNHFDSSKNSNGSHNQTQFSQNMVSASKGKDGSNFSADSYGNGAHLQTISKFVDASKGKGGSKYSENDGYIEVGGHVQNSSSQVHAGDNHGNQFDASKNNLDYQTYTNTDLSSKEKSGNKFNANRNTYEGGQLTKTSQSDVSAKDSHGNHFDASKNLNKQNANVQKSSSNVNASKGKGGSQFEASKTSSGLRQISQDSKSSVNAKQGGNSLDASKSSSKFDKFTQDSNSTVNASKGKGGRNLTASKNSSKNEEHSKSSSSSSNAKQGKKHEYIIKRIIGARSLRSRSQ
ncbi:6700_t:CDS:2 [Gigaspora rosea]|nr:6700_t:CDS:2 [Gigaspora rosea]